MNEIKRIFELLKIFDFRSATWDVFVFLIWGVISVFYAFAAGRGRVINALISIYIAKLLVIKAPFLEEGLARKLPENLISLQQLITFLVLFFVLFLFLGRYVFKTSADGRHLVSIVFSVVFSFFQIGLLINTILRLLPKDITGNLSELTKMVFLHPNADFVWLVLPLAFLIFAGKFIADSNEV